MTYQVVVDGVNLGELLDVDQSPPPNRFMFDGRPESVAEALASWRPWVTVQGSLGHRTFNSGIVHIDTERSLVTVTTGQR